MANHRSPKPGLPVRVGADPFLNMMFDKLVKYIKETRAETKKVVWPDRRYVMAATIIILVIVMLTGLYVMFIDATLTKVFAFLLK